MATICKGCNEEVYRARWVEDDGWYCLDCSDAPRPMTKVPGSLFPIVTSNIVDYPEPITVRSLRELRKLEARFGVANVAFNVEESKWNVPPRSKHGQAKEE